MTTADPRPGLPRFRPDLEGLRAVAILLVLAHHADLPRITGGYVGVDVFFVLSGFLITGILLRELAATGRIDLPAFYGRRARRLLPAALLVLAVTVLASALLLPPLQVSEVAKDGAAAALYASNIRFAAQATDYLQAGLAPSPVLHYWSLGVEEQFYLVWPALLLAVGGRRRRLRARIRSVAWAVGVVFVGSLALSAFLTKVNAPWAFYSLPTRAWELALGALVALAAGHLTRIPPRLAAVAGSTGLALITAAAVLLRPGTPFPGTAALLPALGAALVISAGIGTPVAWPGRALGTSAMRFLGRISYSLYLWHWPLLLLPAAALERQLTLAERLALLTVALPLAAVTQRLVEDPIRHGRLVGTRPAPSLPLAGVLAGVVALASLSVPALVSVPQPTATAGATPKARALPAGLRPALSQAKADKPLVYADGCHLGTPGVTPGACAFGRVDSTTTVVLLGDSHAAQWFPALAVLAEQRGWRLVSLTKSGCPAAGVTVWHEGRKRPYTECDQWRVAALDRIRRERPALVVVSDNREYQVVEAGRPTPSGQRLDDWAAGLRRTLDRLRVSSRAVVLMGDTPRARVDVPVCLSAHPDDVGACATPRDEAVDGPRAEMERETATAALVGYVEPTAWVCPDDPCPPVVGDYLVYRDRDHLTTPFSASLAGRLGAELPIAG